MVFANGAQVLTYDITNGFSAAPNLPRFSTCCDYNGQLFVGNFFDAYQDYGPDAVGWSKIGEAVFELKSPQAAVRCLAARDDEIVAGCWNGNAHLWRLPY